MLPNDGCPNEEVALKYFSLEFANKAGGTSMAGSGGYFTRHGLAF